MNNLNSKQVQIFPISSPRVTEIGGGRTFYEGKVAKLVASLLDKNPNNGKRCFMIDYSVDDKQTHFIDCFMEGRLVSLYLSDSELTQILSGKEFLIIQLVENKFDISSDPEKFGNIYVSYTDGVDLLATNTSAEPAYTGINLFDVDSTDDIDQSTIYLVALQFGIAEDSPMNSRYHVPEFSWVKFQEKSLTFPTIDRIDGVRI